MEEHFPWINDDISPIIKRCCHKPCLTPECILTKTCYIAHCRTCDKYVIKDRNESSS